MPKDEDAPKQHPPLLVPQTVGTDPAIINMLAQTMASLTELLQRQQPTQISVTTAPDLTSTLPFYHGTDNDSFKDWKTAVEAMRDRSQWSDSATLSAGISRIRGRALEWHKTEGVKIKEWGTWIEALGKEFDRPLLFRQWFELVNNRRQRDSETLVDYLYARLQKIKRAKYQLTDEDIVDWLVDGVANQSHKPMLSAFYQLRRGTVQDLIQYGKEIDRQTPDPSEKPRTTGDYGERTYSRNVPTSPLDRAFPRQTSPEIRETKTAVEAGSRSQSTSKSYFLTPNTCARCRSYGHRAKDCPLPDTRTEEEKAAALQRRLSRGNYTATYRNSNIERQINSVVSVCTNFPRDSIVLPAVVNGIETSVLWDNGSAVTLVSRSFATSHNLSTVAETDIILRGPFGGISEPIGTTQATIAIGVAKATIQVHVIESLRHDVIVGLDWRQAIPYDYIDRCDETTHSIEWIPKRRLSTDTRHLNASSFSSPQMLHRPSNYITAARKTQEESRMPTAEKKKRNVPIFGSVGVQMVADCTRPIKLSELPTTQEIHISIQQLENHCSVAEEDFNAMKNILLRNSDVFTKPDDEWGLCLKTEHVIELTDTTPVRMQPYTTSDSNREFIRRELAEWQRRGIIRPSRSPYASPVLIVEQPQHETTPRRLCVDYRFLNAKTKPRAYPMPRVDDLLRRVSRFKYFTKMDIKKAFLNIPLRKEDIHKAAFVTEDGHYEPLRMLFGLTPATMQAVMNDGLEELVATGKVAVYIDDVCICTNDLQEHLQLLDRTLRKLIDLGLRVEMRKCIFLSPSIPFLGFIVSRQGTAIDPDRVSAILKYETPRSKKEIRSFLGFASHYRKYIRDYARIARPLTELTKKDALLTWTPECETAMNTLKKRLTEPPILAAFNPELPTQVHVDASQTAFGAVLTQLHGHETRVVEYASKKVPAPDQHKHSTDLEAIAVHWAVTDRFHKYLQGLSHFDLFTDNWAVAHLMSKKNPNRRFARIILDLASYNFTIRHTSANSNVTADTLSRILAPVNNVFILRAEDSRLTNAQRNDPVLKDIIERLQNSEDGTHPADFRIHKQILMHVTQKDDKEILRVVIPACLKRAVLQCYHDQDGHADSCRTLAKIQKRYHWKQMAKDIADYVKGCESCQRYNCPTGVQTRTLYPRYPSKAPFEQVALDHVGPINTGDPNRYFITAIDLTTRFIVTRPVPDKSTEHLLKFIEEEIVQSFGTPRVLITDNDKVMISRSAQKYLSDRHIQHVQTIPYASETNGLVERANGKILPALRKNIAMDTDHWSDYLRKTTLQVNSQKHIGLGTSPFELLYNFTPRNSVDNDLDIDTSEDIPNSTQLREEANNSLTRYLTNMKHSFDARHRVPRFSVGDEVWYTTGMREKKLGTLYDGPYVICDIDNGMYTIQRDTDNRKKETRTTTAMQLKHYRQQPDFDNDYDVTRLLENYNDQHDTGCSAPHENKEEDIVPPGPTGRRRRRPAWLKDYVTDYADCEDAIVSEQGEC